MHPAYKSSLGEEGHGRDLPALWRGQWWTLDGGHRWERDTWGDRAAGARSSPVLPLRPLGHCQDPQGHLGVFSAFSYHLLLLSCRMLVAEQGCNACTWGTARVRALLLARRGCLAGRGDKTRCVTRMWLVLSLCFLHRHLTAAALTCDVAAC